MSLYGIRKFFGGIGTGTSIGHSHQVAEPELHSAPPSLVFILHATCQLSDKHEFTEFIVNVNVRHQEFFSVALAPPSFVFTIQHMNFSIGTDSSAALLWCSSG
jgi:hypothetical protein